MPYLARISPRFEVPSTHATQEEKLYTQQQIKQLPPSFDAFCPYK